MRIAMSVLSVLVLVACQTTSQSFCQREGFREGTPEFRECVAKQRAIGAKQMNKNAGSGGLGR